LMGFCRTNLFKRLESSGQAFFQSVERHILRNYVYLHAIEKDLPLPIGTQDAEMLDSRLSDDEGEGSIENEDEENDNNAGSNVTAPLRTDADYKNRAADVYGEYAGRFKRRFKWLRPSLFVKELAKGLRSDVQGLLNI